MIAYLRDNPTVRYVIVYALSRFARNRYDDAIMMMTLEKLGVSLVSTTERALDETPAGRAMHGMLAVFNEYQVLVSGEDIRYRMGQKIKNGGSVGTAKIGYRNIRIQFEGREVRTIETDPDRAPFVRMAFELYATGNYGFHDLRDALTDAGLRTKGTRRYGPRPISLHSLGNLLRDRYYLGYVTYDGIENPGRHEPLITPELFSTTSPRDKTSYAPPWIYSASRASCTGPPPTRPARSSTRPSSTGSTSTPTTATRPPVTIA